MQVIYVTALFYEYRDIDDCFREKREWVMVQQAGRDLWETHRPQDIPLYLNSEGRSRCLVLIKSKGLDLLCGCPPTRSTGQMPVPKSHPSHDMSDQGQSHLSSGCSSSAVPPRQATGVKWILCPPLLGICGRDVSGELELPRFAWEALNENLCHFLVADLCWADYPRGYKGFI